VIRSGCSALCAAVVLVLPYSGGGTITPRLDFPAAPERPATLAAPEETAEAPLPPPDEPGDPARADARRPWRPSYPVFLRPLPGDEPDPPPRAAGRVRELVLTFDDGPDLFGTPLVLAELERRGHKAVFFINGGHMVGNRPQDLARSDLIRKIASHGHLVANHTLTHQNLCRQPPEVLEHEIDGNSEIITAATGMRPLLFRSPYGARCRRLDQALRTRDLLQVGWSVDPQDWKGGSEDQIVEYLTRKLARLNGRGILLLHDTQQEAVRALPRILDWIARDNDRQVRQGGIPLRIRDYSVFLPPRPPLPPSGVEPFFRPLLAPMLRTLSADLTRAFASAVPPEVR
jgi:peptidoglycan/xylan/chitin deacetylase (PgdA/CDA1 family)